MYQVGTTPSGSLVYAQLDSSGVAYAPGLPPIDASTFPADLDHAAVQYGDVFSHKIVPVTNGRDTGVTHTTELKYKWTHPAFIPPTYAIGEQTFTYRWVCQSTYNGAIYTPDGSLWSESWTIHIIQDNNGTVRDLGTFVSSQTIDSWDFYAGIGIAMWGSLANFSHQIEVTSDGVTTEPLNRHYSQRFLAFQADAQDVVLPEGVTSYTFQNAVKWTAGLWPDKSGTPVPDADLPLMRVVILDAAGNLVGTSGWQSATQSTPFVYTQDFSWLDSCVDSNKTRIMLVPSGSDVRAKLTSLTKVMKAAQTPLIYTYRFDALARTHAAANVRPTSNDLYYYNNQGATAALQEFVDAPIDITTVRFAGGGESGLAIGEKGPFPVYDYSATDSQGNSVGALVTPDQVGWDGSATLGTTTSITPATIVAGSYLWVNATVASSLPLPQDGSGMKVAATLTATIEPAIGSPQTLQFTSDTSKSTANTATILVSDWANPPQLLFRSVQPLPASIGRHRFKLTWNVKAAVDPSLLNGFIPGAIQTPPVAEQQHVAYTLLKKPDVIGADPAEAGNPWYNSKKFSVVSNDAANDRAILSPLDMATTLAAGASTPQETLRLLTANFYSKSGYSYAPETQKDLICGVGFEGTGALLGLPGIPYDWLILEPILQQPALQCNQVNDIVMILATWDGAQASETHVTPMPDRFLFTRYLKPMGDVAYTSLFCEYWAPTMPTLIGKSEGVHSFLQYAFHFHQYITLSDNGTTLVCDATTRVDSDESRALDDSINPGYVLNARNIDNQSFFRKAYSQEARQSIPVDLRAFLDSVQPGDYATKFLPNGSPAALIPESTYLQHLLFLWGNDNLLVQTGYASGPVGTPGGVFAETFYSLRIRRYLPPQGSTP